MPKAEKAGYLQVTRDEIGVTEKFLKLANRAGGAAGLGYPSLEKKHKPRRPAESKK